MGRTITTIGLESPQSVFQVFNGGLKLGWQGVSRRQKNLKKRRPRAGRFISRSGRLDASTTYVAEGPRFLKEYQANR